MNREHVAMMGSPNPSGVMRLELSFREKGVPEYLHADNRCGRFASVIRGQVGSGPLAVPVAIKLEHAPLTDGPTLRPGIVKFANEFQAQLKVHHSSSTGRSSRVVRMMQFWPLSENKSCDELPPCIVCPHAVSALEPCCPECRQPLDETLHCRHKLHQTASYDVILQTTVRNATACKSCPWRKESTECPAVWLNQQPRRLLLLEQLDISLDEYLSSRKHFNSVATSDESSDTPLRTRRCVPDDLEVDQPDTQRTRRLRQHLQALAVRRRQAGADSHSELSELDDLRTVIGLFSDLLQGLSELWRAGMAHLDLKLDNLCLSLENDRSVLRIIDLGNAVNQETQWNLRLRSLHEDVVRHLEGNFFSAPELTTQRFSRQVAAWRTVSPFVQLKWSLNPSSPEAPPPLPNDWFYYSDQSDTQHFCRIIDTQQLDGEVTVTAIACRPGEFPPQERMTPPGGTQWPSWEDFQEVCVVAHAGPSADLFSAGLLLVHLVCQGQADILQWNQALPEMARILRTAPTDIIELPTRSVLSWLTERCHETRLNILDLTAKLLPKSPDARRLAEDLVGIALRMMLRGIPAFSLAENRGDECGAVIGIIQRAISGVKNRLTIAGRRADATTRLRHFRIRGCERITDWLMTYRGHATGKSAVNARPVYRNHLLRDTVDSLSDDEIACQQEYLGLLKIYQGNADWLLEDLRIFRGEVTSNLVDTEQMHPLLISMMNVLSGQRILHGHEGESETANVDSGHVPLHDFMKTSGSGSNAPERFQQDLKNVQSDLILVRKAEGIGRSLLTPLLKDSILRSNASELDSIEQAIESLLRACRKCVQSQQICRRMHDELVLQQKEVIRLWHRLGNEQFSGWKLLGRLVNGRIESRRKVVAEWDEAVTRTLKQLNAICLQLQRDLIQECRNQQLAYHKGVRGWMRRLVDRLMHRVGTFPLHVPSEPTKSRVMAMKKYSVRLAALLSPSVQG